MSSALVAVTVWMLLPHAATNEDNTESADATLNVALPFGLEKLNLTDEQIVRIQEIQAFYSTRLREVEEEMFRLRSQGPVDMFNVLTGEQKERFRKLLAGDKAEGKAEDRGKDGR